MFCEKCGNKVEADWTFCKNCGNPINKEPEKTEAPSDKTIILSDEMRKELLKSDKKPEEPKQKNNFFKKNMWWLIAAGAVLLVAIVSLIVLLCRPEYKTVDLENYIAVKLSGYENFGEIDGSPIDTDKLLGDVFGTLPDENYETDEERREYYNFLADAEAVTSALKSEIEYPLGSASGSLKNGDRIKIKLSANGETFKKYGIVFKNEAIVRELIIGTDTEALPGFSEISFLSYFKPTFIGFNGHGKISFNEDEIKGSVDNPSTTVQRVDFAICKDAVSDISVKFEIVTESETVEKSVKLSLSKTSDFTNGDKLTVSAEPKDLSFLETYGLSISETSKTITVDGLSDNVNANILGAARLRFEGVNNAGYVYIEPGEYFIDLTHSVYGIDVIKVTITEERDGYKADVTVPDTEGEYGSTKQVRVRLLLSRAIELSNGDKVSLYLSLDDIEPLAESGITAGPLSVDFTVSGLPEPDIE